MRLFCDDQRIPPDGFELARTITQAIKILSESNVEFLSLDYDIRHRRDSSLLDENFSAVARFVTLMDEGSKPKVIFLHTANHNGSLEMARILSGSGSKLVRISPENYEEGIEKFLKRWGKRKR